MRSLVFWLILAGSAFANDGYSELGIGGLVLKNTDAISMDKEELYVSPSKITVDYLMTNQTDKDVEALVMFPLPDVSLPAEYDSARGLVDLGRDLKFKTIVDGKPFPITLEQRAFVGEVDVTDAVVAAGLPVNGVVEKFEKLVLALPMETRQNLIKLGALPKYTDDAGNEAPYPPDLYFAPEWTIRSSMVRTQIFPAGKTIAVRHSYVPVTGASVGGNLAPDMRKQDFFTDKVKAHCIDDSWLASFDKQVEKRAQGDVTAPYSEVWVKYILKSGATWKGPIKDFRLVVDKQNKDSLVSFCSEGVKKIGPTQFEVRKKDFEPTEDLNVLFINWAAGE